MTAPIRVATESIVRGLKAVGSARSSTARFWPGIDIGPRACPSLQRSAATPPGEPEIEHLGVSAHRDEDVGRLDVTMHDASAVSSRQCIGDLRTEPHDDIDRQRPPVDASAERLTFQFHHDERVTFVFADVIDRADVRMIESRGGPRLAPETPRQPGCCPPYCAVRNLSAAYRPSCVSSALQTIPIPPAPSFSMMRKCEKWRPSSSRSSGTRAVASSGARSEDSRPGWQAVGRSRQPRHGQQAAIEFRSQRVIAAAGIAKKCRAIGRRPLQRGTEDHLETLPGIRMIGHVSLRDLPRVSRRNSQARATCHSRVTVARIIESNSATSLGEPPK